VDEDFVLVLNVERLLDFDIPSDLDEVAAAAVA
jgi:purine-binding chemotaxis protein CheW